MTTSISFVAGNGATINLAQHDAKVIVTVRHGKIDINHTASRIQHPQHGAAIFVKHGFDETTIRIPAGALAEVDALFAAVAIDAAKAQLAAQRKGLALALECLIDEGDAVRRASVAEGNHLRTLDNSAAVEAAHQALAAFDAAHPEVLATIEAAASTERAERFAAGMRA